MQQPDLHQHVGLSAATALHLKQDGEKNSKQAQNLHPKP